MNTFKIIMLYTACMTIFFSGFFQINNASAESLIPENLVIKEIFQPGSGSSIGKIQMAQGKAVIIHSDELTAYAVKENLPLFKKDTIITLEKGRVRLIFNDGSVITTASGTKIKLTENIYDMPSKTRMSFISMAWGKARFIVKKFTDFTEPEFKIKTKTAVVGVRGSDFIIKSSENLTEVTALDDTTLEIISLAALEKPPVKVHEFEKIFVETGLIPSDIIAVSPEMIQDIIMDMEIIPERIEPEHITGIQKRNAVQRSSDRREAGPRPAEPRPELKTGEVKDRMKPEKAPPDKPVEKHDMSEPKADAPPVMAPPPPFPPPDTAISLDKGMKPEPPPKPPEAPPEIFDENAVNKNEEFIREKHIDIIERKIEDFHMLPELPKPPGR